MSKASLYLFFTTFSGGVHKLRLQDVVEVGGQKTLVNVVCKRPLIIISDFKILTCLVAKIEVLALNTKNNEKTIN